MKPNAKGANAVYAPPGIDPAATLRPDIIARLELLRIVWRPDRDAAMAIKVCEALEVYLNSGKAPAQAGSDG